MKAQNLSYSARVFNRICSLYVRFILCGLLFFYICIYPPLVSSCFIELSTRLIVETLILLIVVFYIQLKNNFKVPKDMVWLVVLVLLYWIFSLDKSRQVFSFFNKFVFFIFLVRVVHNNRGMFVLLRKLWVVMWFILSISAILACISFTLGIVSYSPLNFSDYTYQYNPFLGLVLPKQVGTFILPRYSGWFIEPSYLAFFFGINVFFASNFFVNVNKLRCFKWLNAIAGFLTFSTAFYVFFLSYYLYRMVRRKILMSKIIICLLLSSALFLIIYIWKNPDLVYYTSFADRIWRLEGVWNVLINIDIKHIIFGFGIIPLQTAVGGGTCLGLVDILLGRGLLLFIFVMHLIFRYTRYNPMLFLFIIFYSFSFSFLWYPLFLFAVALGHESYLCNNKSYILQKSQNPT